MVHLDTDTPTKGQTMTDSALMNVVQGMTVGQFDEMKGWLMDCGIEVTDTDTVYWVARMVHKNYDGGIEAFATATAGI